MQSSTSSKKFHAFDNHMIGRFVLGVFLFAGVLSSTFMISKQTDNRDQAMRATSTVEIRPVIANGANTLTAGQPSLLNLQMNTSGTPIAGVQLVYKMYSSVVPTFTADQITVPVESGLTVLYKNVTAIPGGYEVKVALRPSGALNADLSYSNSAFVSIVQMNFTPVSDGTVNFAYDTESTSVLNTSSVNVLKIPTSFSINVGQSNRRDAEFEDRRMTPFATRPMSTPRMTPYATRGMMTPRPTRQESQQPHMDR